MKLSKKFSISVSCNGSNECLRTFHPDFSKQPFVSEQFAEVDILEECENEEGAEKFGLEWMNKVLFILKQANH